MIDSIEHAYEVKDSAKLQNNGFVAVVLAKLIVENREKKLN